jgi:hypothetical protein
MREGYKKEPKNSPHYLNLGRIYLINNNKADAIKTFTEGFNYEAYQQISKLCIFYYYRREIVGEDNFYYKCNYS